MRLLSTRRSAAIAAIGLFVAMLGASGAQAAPGSLSIAPGVVERIARPGGVGAVEISNTTRRALKVRVALRPWIQARNGDVEPHRGKTLGRMRPGVSWFRLASGASRTVGLGLKSRPALGSLYGAVEVIGIPPRRRRGSEIRVAYRLVTSLRLHPPKRARRFRAKAGRLVRFGGRRRGALLLAVSNTGNTIAPIGGRARIKGRGRTLRTGIPAKRILPGATVFLRVARLRGQLPRGRYRVAVGLKQGERRLGFVKRRVFLR